MAGLQPFKILIADDSAHMRQILTAMLRAAGAEMIREATDGAGAFRALAQFPADLALVDFNMAPLDGVAFTRLVRNSADSPNIFLPVIMMTGHAERRRVHDADDRHVAVRERHGDGEVRQAVHEVGGAVEWVDDPRPLGVARRSTGSGQHAFLGEHGVVRVRAQQAADDDGLGGAVGLGDQFAPLPLGLGARGRRRPPPQQVGPRLGGERQREVEERPQVGHAPPSARSIAATMSSCSCLRSRLRPSFFGS